MLIGLLLRLAAAALVPRTARWALLRACGVNVNTRRVAPGSRFTSSRVTIGHGSYINTGCLFDAFDHITIGDRCAIGPGVMFATTSHELGGPEQRAGALEAAPITVGDGCWIGARSVVLPGVTLGSGAVIAAGSVVTGDCEPNRLYGGVPARELRAL